MFNQITGLDRNLRLGKQERVASQLTRIKCETQLQPMQSLHAAAVLLIVITSFNTLFQLNNKPKSRHKVAETSVVKKELLV